MATRATTLTPAEFAYFALGMESLYDWQIEALEVIGLQDDGGKPLSVVAANGSGKTACLVAPAVLWFLSKYPRGQAIITSGSFRQVEKQLWPAMRAYSSKVPSMQFLQTEIKTADGGFALGFSTVDPGKAEGWHPKVGRETDPVMVVIDEAKTVPNSIFEAFDRCSMVFQMWVSSPGAPAGEFYESHHSNSKYFHNLKVTSEMCQHIDPEKRGRDAEKYGVDSPLYRSMHLAEFTADVERLILPADALRQAVEFPPYEERGGERVAFFDFAAGRDENVFALRDGNTVRIIDAWQEPNTSQAVRRFMSTAQGLGLNGSQCWGDADGLGTPMICQFADEGFRINSFHGGARARDPDNYSNLISEVWFEGTRKIERGRINLGELDPMTFKQISTRFTEWDNRGKLRVERKEDMAKRGIKSPDRADAFLGCIMCGAWMTGAVTGEAMKRTIVPRSPFSSGGVRF